MNRTDLAKENSNRLEDEVTPAKVAKILTTLEDVVLEEVKSGTKVSLPGFVAFEKAEREARTYRNPRTGEPLEAPATSYVKISGLSKVKSLFKS